MSLSSFSGGIAGLLWVLLSLSADLSAQTSIERNFFFSPMTQEGDLAQNTVTALLQDRSGFVWVGTQGGLHRFDGYDFKRFQHHPGDANGIPDNFITALAESSEGKLYLGTITHGVVHWDPTSQHFLEIAGKPDERARRDAITSLLPDDEEGIWIGSRFGLEYLSRGGKRSDVLRLPPDDPEQSGVRALSRCADGALFVGTQNGLYRVNPGSLRARTLTTPEDARGVNALHCDRTGVLWVSVGHRLFEWQNGELRLAWDGGQSKPQALQADLISIVEDQTGVLWLASNSQGLVRYLPTEDRAEVITHQSSLNGSIPENTLSTLMLDRSGLLWVGGLVSGISVVKPEGTPFTYLREDTTEQAKADANNVRAMAADGDRGLWIGTETLGLKHYDFQSGGTTYLNQVFAKALGAGKLPREFRVTAIRQAEAPDQYWVATNAGVFSFNARTRNAQALPVDRERADALPIADVRALFVSSDGTVWMGTRSAGLVSYNPTTQKWQQWGVTVSSDEPGLWHAGVLALHEDDQRRLWIGTLAGLNVLDRDTGILRSVDRDQSRPDALVGEVVRTIIQAADGTIWIGTHGGLNRLIADQGGRMVFRRYMMDQGLASDTVYEALEDAAGKIWISTNEGISRLDPKTDEIQNFGLSDGLQSLEFNGGAGTELPDGRLAFAGTEGVNWFRPDRVIARSAVTPMAFTAIQVGNQRRDILDPEAFTRLSLQPKDRVLMLAFSALDFLYMKQRRYSYRLNGYDQDWIDLGNRREVAFTNLPAGNYQLEIGSSADGRTRDAQTLQLKIEVLPYWWQRAWAQAAIAAAVALLLLMGWLARRRASLELTRQNEKMKVFSQRLSSALWASKDGFWDWDLVKDVMFLSGPEEFVGPGRETRVTTQEWRDLAIHKDDQVRVEAALEEHITGRSDHYEAEYRVRTFSGRSAWILARGRAVRRDAHGRALQVAGTFRDVSQERLLDRDRRIAQEVIRSMREVVCVTDLQFRFVSVNEAFCRVTGYTMDEVGGQDSDLLNSDQHPPEFYRQMRETLLMRGQWGGELWQRRKDGEQFLSSLEINEVCDSSGLRQYWVAVLTDITDRKRAEQELRYLANYDTLTGLPNRTLLGERLAHSLIRARRLGNKVAVLFLDLDRFKHVNDSMGHAAGDRLLKAAAARIVSNVRETDTVARLGGDEFTVVLEDLRDIIEAEAVARKLLVGFQKPLEIDGRHEVVISPSIGLSIYPEHGQVPTDLLKHADTAMYHAKDRGRNTYQVYTDAMDAQARLRASMAGQLHKALERNELHLVFQPKMALADRSFTGAEALLRWRNPVLGDVSPVTFIPIAEETGLIVPIGEWVLQQACVQIQRWTAAGLTEPSIAVNVSALQLFRGELATRLRQILEAADVPARRIEIELTESMLMGNPEQSIETLTRIKALGVHIAIDDFGTGYSSLAYLKRLPIDTLKIDKTFIADLSIDPDGEAITTTVIMMAHSLGLDVIAEGVETPEQMRYLAEHRCDKVQGNLISQPLDADRIMQFLLERQNLK